jgi:hypothetical protein
LQEGARADAELEDLHDEPEAAGPAAVERLSVREVAAALSMSIGAVSKYLTAVRAALVSGWIRYRHAAHAGEPAQADFSPVDQVMDIVSAQPEEAWAFVLAVLNADASECIQANLAAGPLEDMLVSFGAKIIDRVEDEASVNPTFAHLLGGVWRNSIDADVWTRLLAARKGVSW